VVPIVLAGGEVFIVGVVLGAEGVVGGRGHLAALALLGLD